MKTIRYYSNILVLFSISIFLPWILPAQEIKKPIPKDYSKWYTLGNPQISDNGQWTFYANLYKQAQDTLFLQHIALDVQYQIPSGSKGTFSPDNTRFAFVHQKSKEVHWIDLETGKKNVLAKGSQYNFSHDGRYLIVFSKEDGNNILYIHDFKHNNQRKIENVIEHQLDAQRKSLSYSTGLAGENTLTLISLTEPWHPRIIEQNSSNSYLKLTWDENGRHLAFLEFQEPFKQEQGRYKIHFITEINSNPRSYEFDPATISDFPKNMSVSAFTRLIVSKDGSSLFFDIQSKEGLEDLKEPTTVQVWHSQDPTPYPAQAASDWWEEGPKLSVWWPRTNAFLQIATKEQPEAKLTGDFKYALTFDPEDYRPQYKYGEDYVDIYLTDLTTGNRKLIIEKQLYTSYPHTISSPGGKFVGYFKNQHWWVYDIQKDKHTNISSGLKVATYNVEYDRSGTPPPYGNPGWTDGDKEIIIYDQYDIWLVSPDGKTKKKVTNGREQKIKYRVYEWSENDRGSQPFFGFTGSSFDSKKGLVLEMFGSTTKKSGYAIWNKQNGLNQLVYKDMFLYGLKKSKEADAWIHLESKNDMPPRLVYTSSTSTKIVIQGNPHYIEYPTGKSELIDYKAMDEKSLQGALFYPADYQAGKKYPMIVYIYEGLSQNLHRFIAPSLEERAGFNRSNYTTDGYFVFYPDIVYTLNNPGNSALQCVTSAVNEVIGTDMVDEDRIGLIGHSYGGYEASFIISQTDMFTAAVAGSPWTNLVSSYFAYDWVQIAAPFWRFEKQQNRFLGSYYQYKEEYVRNSPVHQAEGIETPLLIWHGDNDKNIEWYQGIELYLALRRLEREGIFLVYPDEGHHLEKNKNIIDLNHRIKHWFDYYLKEYEPERWLAPK